METLMKSAAPENLEALDDAALEGAKGGAGLSFPERPPLLEPLPRFPVPTLPPLPSFARPRPPLPDPPPFRRLPIATLPILRFD
jgi:hypothetical protein